MDSEHTDTIPMISYHDRREYPRNESEGNPNHTVWSGTVNDLPDSLDIVIENEIGGYDPYDLPGKTA